MEQQQVYYNKKQAIREGRKRHRKEYRECKQKFHKTAKMKQINFSNKKQAIREGRKRHRKEYRECKKKFHKASKMKLNNLSNKEQAIREGRKRHRKEYRERKKMFRKMAKIKRIKFSNQQVMNKESTNQFNRLIYPFVQTLIEDNFKTLRSSNSSHREPEDVQREIGTSHLGVEECRSGSGHCILETSAEGLKADTEAVKQLVNVPALLEKPVTQQAQKRLEDNQNLSIKANGNHKSSQILTDIVLLRRSGRKTSNVIVEENKKILESRLRNSFECGLRVINCEEKGRGIVADQMFNKGDFVVEYCGDLIDLREARRREAIYSEDGNVGNFMYFFKHQEKNYCIDATAETDHLGRLVNHSRNGNLIPKIIEMDKKPHLVLFAKHTIKIGDEVTYDYGDRAKKSLLNHPWLAH